MLKITITKNDAGQRFDRFLRKISRHLPLSFIHRAIRVGKVKINGKRKRSEKVLEEGDSLTFFAPEFNIKEKKSGKLIKDNPLKSWILEENESFIVIDKPAGLAVHGGTGIEGDTLTSLLLNYLSGEDSGLSYKPALVHRLDKETSGLIIAAKNAPAHRELSKQFRKRLVEKTYMAKISGDLEKKTGEINISLEDKEGKAQNAQTRYKVIKQLDGESQLELNITTGRTRQIRRHLSLMGIPVIGDVRYKGAKADRLMLHALTLKLTNPDTGKSAVYTSSLPAEFS